MLKLSDTLVVSLFGGPGTGKSTNAALTFGELKMRGYNAELAPEYAKDVVWEARTKPLEFQPYIIGKQMFRIQRLIGEVDVVITDSPPILTEVYCKRRDEHWFQAVNNIYKDWWTLNIFLKRNLQHHPYNPKGRIQTEEQAVQMDKTILDILDRRNIEYYDVAIDRSGQTVAEIVELVENELAEHIFHEPLT